MATQKTRPASQKSSQKTARAAAVKKSAPQKSTAKSASPKVGALKKVVKKSATSKAAPQKSVKKVATSQVAKAVKKLPAKAATAAVKKVSKAAAAQKTAKKVVKKVVKKAATAVSKSVAVKSKAAPKKPVQAKAKAKTQKAPVKKLLVVASAAKPGSKVRAVKRATSAAATEQQPYSPLEKRTAQRAPVNLLIDYQTLDQFFHDYATNISLGGVFIRSSAPLPVGTRLKVSFSLPGLDSVVETTGVVARVEDARSQEGFSGMGISFEDLDAQSKKLVDYLVEQSLGDEA